MKKEITKEEFDNALNIVKSYRLQLESKLSELDKQLEGNFVDIKKTDLVCYPLASTRLINCLKIAEDRVGITRTAGMHFIFQDLEGLSVTKFHRNARNCGKKTIEELKRLCFYAGVKLKP